MFRRQHGSSDNSPIRFVKSPKAQNKLASFGNALMNHPMSPRTIRGIKLNFIIFTCYILHSHRSWATHQTSLILCYLSYVLYFIWCLPCIIISVSFMCIHIDTRYRRDAKWCSTLLGPCSSNRQTPHYYKPYFGYLLLVSLWVMHFIWIWLTT